MPSLREVMAWLAMWILMGCNIALIYVYTGDYFAMVVAAAAIVAAYVCGKVSVEMSVEKALQIIGTAYFSSGENGGTHA